MLLIYISVVVLFVARSAHGANILAILPTPSYSHQIAFAGLWKELSLRGHNVTLITTDPLNDPRLTNLTEIDMKWTYNSMQSITKIAEERQMHLWNFYETLSSLYQSISRAQLSHPSVQELIQNKAVKFDVVLVEFLSPEYLAFAEIHKCPKILFSTLDPLVMNHNYLGNTIHPVLYPDMTLPFEQARNFKERVSSTLFTWYALYFYSYNWLPDKDDIIKNYFKLENKTEELINDVDLFLRNVIPVIHSIRAVGPATVDVGDLQRSAPGNTLTADLKEFLDGAKDGFVYFSLGSNVKSKELNRNSVDNIMQALGELPYKVLWKFEDDHLHGKPQNVKLVKWAPQVAVLAHPNIKVFVTQGGLQSMEEGIFNEVPFVVIPFFGDQDKNADLMRNKGIAKVIGRFPHIQKDILKEAILEVVTNPSYKNRVQRLKQLAMDTPMTGLEKSIWWIEYVIRNKGAKHLRNPAADTPFYQYYLLDVIGFLVTVAVSIFTLLFILVRKIVNLLRHFVKNPILLNKKIQ